MNPALESVTQKIVTRSKATRQAYLERARRVVRRQIVLAAHRLAGLLNEIFGD